MAASGLASTGNNSAWLHGCRVSFPVYDHKDTTTHLLDHTRLHDSLVQGTIALLLLSFCQKVSMMPTLQAHCLPGQGWQSAWHDWNSLDRRHGCKVWHLVVLPTRKRGALVRPSQITWFTSRRGMYPTFLPQRRRCWRLMGHWSGLALVVRWPDLA